MSTLSETRNESSQNGVSKNTIPHSETQTRKGKKLTAKPIQTFNWTLILMNPNHIWNINRHVKFLHNIGHESPFIIQKHTLVISVLVKIFGDFSPSRCLVLHRHNPHLVVYILSHWFNEYIHFTKWEGDSVRTDYLGLYNIDS